MKTNKSSAKVDNRGFVTPPGFSSYLDYLNQTTGLAWVPAKGGYKTKLEGWDAHTKDHLVPGGASKAKKKVVVSKKGR